MLYDGGSQSMYSRFKSALGEVDYVPGVKGKAGLAPHSPALDGGGGVSIVLSVRKLNVPKELPSGRTDGRRCIVKEEGVEDKCSFHQYPLTYPVLSPPFPSALLIPLST